MGKKYDPTKKQAKYPFTWSDESRDSDENDTVKFKVDRAGGIKFENSMYKLEGTESYEMLIKWLISLKEQLFSKTGIALADKFSVLDRILGGKAQTKIRTVVPKIYDADMATTYPNFVWESPRVNRVLYV